MAENIAKVYVEFARAALQVDKKDIKGLENLYWFTIEYGLCYENGRLKTYGAGNLSSVADLSRCVDPMQVEHLDFDIEKMCATNYDPTIQQPLLFVSPSLEEALNSLSNYFHENFDM